MVTPDPGSARAFYGFAALVVAPAVAGVATVAVRLAQDGDARTAAGFALLALWLTVPTAVAIARLARRPPCA